jgi:hypothetical protein
MITLKNKHKSPIKEYDEKMTVNFKNSQHTDTLKKSVSTPIFEKAYDRHNPQLDTTFLSERNMFIE